MAMVELLTKADLDKFRAELLEDIRSMLAASGKLQEKKWLRSAEVRKMMGISPGTLQNLRINGTLPYSAVGGIHYYLLSDVIKMMDKKR